MTLKMPPLFFKNAQVVPVVPFPYQAFDLRLMRVTLDAL